MYAINLRPKYNAKTASIVHRTSRPTNTAISNVRREACNADAVITTGVNGNGGGKTVATKTDTPALFSIFFLNFSIFFSLKKRSSPFSPALRMIVSITNTPTIDPIRSEEQRLNSSHSQ